MGQSRPTVILRKVQPVRKTIPATVAGVLFLSCIILANFVTTHFGGDDHLVDLTFGLGLVSATAGTYFAGLTFVLRDTIQDLAGRRWTLVLIVAGASLSYLVADPFIALASGVAFLVSETVDFAIYSPLREGGYVRAAIASNIAGAFVDTVLFLWIAGFPIWSAVGGQMFGKLAVTAVVVAGVWLARYQSREMATA